MMGRHLSFRCLSWLFFAVLIATMSVDAYSVPMLDELCAQDFIPELYVNGLPLGVDGDSGGSRSEASVTLTFLSGSGEASGYRELVG